MNPSKTIIKFKQSAEQVDGSVKRIVGLVEAKHILGLFEIADLDANPRSAKIGNVTDDIIESINGVPELFPFMTKGILVGALICKTLERKRYELEFENTDVEGILDGGHNMLAIGIYFLSMAVEDSRVIRRVKTWPDLKEAWNLHRTEIYAIKDDFSFHIPLEIIAPSNSEDINILEAFNHSLLDICAARNNNVQLTLETKANKKGFYDEVQKALPGELAKAVEWKTNDGGKIKVRDLIALAWIPLSRIDIPDGVSVPSPNKIYNKKSECSLAFDRLMSNDEVTKSHDNYEHKLHNDRVRSAIQILGDIPKLYDKIYCDFPEAYNKATNGRFGRNPIVKMRPGRSKFTHKSVGCQYPDGLIIPLVYGLSALLEQKDDVLIWKSNPEDFLDRWLIDIARSYRMVLEMAQFDPQKIGKSDTSYDFALNEFENCLLKQQNEEVTN